MKVVKKHVMGICAYRGERRIQTVITNTCLEEHPLNLLTQQKPKCNAKIRQTVEPQRSVLEMQFNAQTRDKIPIAAAETFLCYVKHFRMKRCKKAALGPKLQDHFRLHKDLAIKRPYGISTSAAHELKVQLTWRLLSDAVLTRAKIPLGGYELTKQGGISPTFQTKEDQLINCTQTILTVLPKWEVV